MYDSGFSINLAFMNIGPRAWRYQLAAPFVPAVAVCVLVWLCPGNVTLKEVIESRTDLDRIPSLVHEERTLCRGVQVILPASEQ